MPKEAQRHYEQAAITFEALGSPRSAYVLNNLVVLIAKQGYAKQGDRRRAEQILRKAREILETTKMCSHEKAHRHFGYRPEVSLAEGVGETIAWYKAEEWL